MRHTTTAAVTLALAPLLPAAAGDVHVVDDSFGSTAEFQVIDAAIANSSDGDIILVKAGFYDPFWMSGKALTIVAEEGAYVATNYTSVVRNLGAGQQALLMGLQLGNASLPLEVLANQGAVWIHECVVLGDGTSTPGVHDAAHIENNAEVVISRSWIEGVTAGGGAGLLAEDSDLFAWDTRFDGGQANEFVYTGGPGLRLEDGFLFAANCEFRGGDGTEGADFGSCIGPGDGGHGLELVQGSQPTSAVLAFPTYAHGVAGPPAPGCPAGVDGVNLALSGGAAASVQALAAPRTFRVSPGVVRSGQATTLTFDAPAGDLAFAAVSASIAPVFAPTVNGSIVPANPLTLLTLGVVPPSGQLDVPANVILPAGVEGVVAKTQGFYFSSTDGFVVSTPAALVMLASNL